jgi:hypothetical protein
VSDVARRKNLIQTSIPGIIPGTDTGKDLKKIFQECLHVAGSARCAVKEDLPDLKIEDWPRSVLVF